jgi:inhibitor of cysteine peptidase
MRRPIIALALALAAFALPAIAQELSGDVYTDPATPISVANGHAFLVALPSNPTTGYSWTASVSNASVENEGSAYQAHPAATGMMGVGGQQIFSFEGNAKGTATITFSYARPFEKGKPAAKTSIFHVTVR